MPLLFITSKKLTCQYSLSAVIYFALSDSGEKFTFFDGASDIWARDYMPVKTKSSKYISFRYELSYLADDPQLRTNFKTDIAPHWPLLLHIQISILTAKIFAVKGKSRYHRQGVLKTWICRFF